MKASVFVIKRQTFCLTIWMSLMTRFSLPLSLFSLAVSLSHTHPSSFLANELCDWQLDYWALLCNPLISPFKIITHRMKRSPQTRVYNNTKSHAIVKLCCIYTWINKCSFHINQYIQAKSVKKLGAQGIRDTRLGKKGQNKRKLFSGKGPFWYWNL